MIHSKYGKSYDTADGTEQDHVGSHISGDVSTPVALAAIAEASAGDACDDNGSPLLLQPPISPLELSTKPAWSVLSLQALNWAIRDANWSENQANVRRDRESAERRTLGTAELEAERVASRAHAYRNRDRNHWENT